MNVLLSKQEAEDKQDKHACCHTYHSPLPAFCRIIPSEGVAERLPNEQTDEGTRVGEKHSERGKYRFLLRAVCHHAEHAPIRHVDGGIDCHHQDICDVSPDKLCRIAPIGSSEEQNATDTNGAAIQSK